MEDGRFGKREGGVRAVVVSAPGDLILSAVPDPTPQAGDVVVGVRGCGICGTDLHIVREGLPTVRYPLVPGHEAWGEVIGTDASVSDLGVGDLVAIDPSLPCGICGRCQRGQANLCERWGAVGATRAGAWAEFVAVPRANAHRLTDDYPIACASLIEPVACAVHGVERLQLRSAKSGLIFGAGTMGLLLAILLELHGVEPVTLVEVNERRRDLAGRLCSFPVARPDDLGDIKMDYVIDATGNPAAIASALDHVAPGGTCMVFGVASPDAQVSIAPYQIYQREITIVGSMAILRSFGTAVEVVRKWSGRFQPLLTHTYPLERVTQALATLEAGDGMKITLVP
jgi:2-desacetyl-2-hydroxyethyl bacteriochlorophyllide A dehydrogenase